MNEWFTLLETTIREHDILETDIYNMDEKGFMMGISGRAKIVVKATNRNKSVTTDGNREWVTVIESVRSKEKFIRKSGSKTLRSYETPTLRQVQTDGQIMSLDIYGLPGYLNHQRVVQLG